VNWSSQVLWLCSFFVFYTWVGYPALLWVLRHFCSRSVRRDGLAARPSVSIIVPAHNEEKRIAAKIQNCLDLDYPRERLEILVILDHCTDGTEQIVEEFVARDQRVRLLRGAGRMGKSGVQNLAAQAAKGEILFLTDVEARTRADVL